MKNKNLKLNNEYYTSHLITYIGNKRSLLSFIEEAILHIKKDLGKKSISVIDGFSGSGSVSRMLLSHSYKLISNDLENYTYYINKSYLTSKKKVDLIGLKKWVNYLNKNKLKKYNIDYFISNNYAPKDDKNIKLGERVFYTTENGIIIDNLRYLIQNKVPKQFKDYLMANLLIKASIHTNTSGVFKGFHKKNGIGHYGGKGENALSRIKKQINIELPILIDHSCEVMVEKKDINKLVREYSKEKFDVVYYDPPYNQHPYGSNYFMLNLIASKENLEIQNGVSGIQKNWNRSDYNKRIRAEEAMEDLIKNTNSRYIIISYNNEGIIPVSNFKKILKKYGKVILKKQDYNTYRGSRNLKNRNIKVKELIWILKKI